MGAKLRQQIFRGHNSSNRGFRYRLLSPTELDQLELKAAKIVAGNAEADGDTASQLLRQTRLNEGVKMMLVAITKKPVDVPPPPPKGAKDADGNKLPPAEEPVLEDPALWEAVDVGRLTLPGEFNLDTLLSEFPSDYAHLKVVFAFNHEANLVEVDDVLKKERTVSTA